MPEPRASREEALRFIAQGGEQGAGLLGERFGRRSSLDPNLFGRIGNAAIPGLREAGQATRQFGLENTNLVDLARTFVEPATDPNAGEIAKLLEVFASGLPLGGMVKAFTGSPVGPKALKGGKLSSGLAGSAAEGTLRTGQGANAFGAGLYLAENPKVARAYQAEFGGNLSAQILADTPKGTKDVGGLVRGIEFRGAPLNDDAVLDARNSLERHATELGEDASVSDVFKSVREEIGRGAFHDRTSSEELLFALDKMEELSPHIKRDIGFLYETKINAEPGDFLDWDKPLSEQPKKIQKAVDELQRSGKTSLTGIPAKNMTGERFYKSMNGTDEAASLALRDAGIPGVRYLDQGSRGAGQFDVFTHNVNPNPAKRIGVVNKQTGKETFFNSTEALDSFLSENVEQTRNIVLFDDSLIDIVSINGRKVPARQRQEALDALREVEQAQGFPSARLPVKEPK